MALKFLNKKGWHTGSLLKHRERVEGRAKAQGRAEEVGRAPQTDLSKPLKPYSSAASKQQASASVQGALF
ncbi:hypothetical protein L3X38_002807 [Prunus dulcis]|uniref:Uncharacterized protein n=1 Tax=Prunus dulcis TaxID=3755 RepID=A0AAD4WV64_PRUDU|nr:hypothetical protein L3X38_002807 [Prunus dulcis]